MTEAKPNVWIVRAGKNGEDEPRALSDGMAIIGFRPVADMTSCKAFDDVLAAVTHAYPSDKATSCKAWAHQLWKFRANIRPGDIAVLPMKTAKHRISLGRFTGDYEYREIDGVPRHVRSVSWEQKDIARTEFQQDLLYSFGAFSTVCQVSRNNAAERVLAVLGGQADPGYGELDSVTDGGGTITNGPQDDSLDISQAAHDEILAFIRREFPDHQLARLVAAVLEADGFVTFVSPPGPDGGADILAARGPLGLDRPTLCVQVKATSSKANVDIYRALRGSMTHFQAEQGLLMCWAGFTEAVHREARQHLFSVRLWDQTDLAEAVYRTYEQLPAEIQAEMPLKPVWVLVHDGDED